MNYIFPIFRNVSICISAFFVAVFIPLNAQVYNLDGGLNGQTITTCKGLFRDSGGGTYGQCGFYSNNEDRVVTFCSGNGKPIRFSFIWWSIESNNDKLIVYDGIDVNAPQIGVVTGSAFNNENPNFFTSSGTCLTFRFISNSSNTGCGWEANIGCQPEPCGNNNPPASDLCSTAPLICNFNGYCGNTGGWYTPENQGSTLASNFCGTIENNSWISFIAEQNSASFRFTSSNCFSTSEGIQVTIFSTINCTQFTPVSNCVSQSSGPGVFTINTNTSLVPGNRYYIMIDGFGGNFCDYSIVPLTGVRALSISGPPENTVCANQTATITVNGAGSGATYQWSPLSAISGPANGPSIIANPGSVTTTYTVTVNNPSGCTQETLQYTLLVNALDISITGDTSICPGESTQLSASASANPPTVTYSNNTTVNIPDNNSTGITSNINVSGLSGTVADLLQSVCINIQHSFVSDLEVLLRCPNGTIINLSMRRGGGGSGYSGTCFASTGPPISSGTAPFLGTYTPEQPLSNLNGCNVNGTWSLIVRDRLSSDVGRLLNWSINFKNQPTFSWSPSSGLSSTTGSTVTANPPVTTTYIVTAQDLKGCSSQRAVTVVVGNNILPVFSPIGPLCLNSIPPALPLVSSNGINGTWSPSLINTSALGNTTYTFTPAAGECAISTTLNINITDPIIPVFDSINPFCAGATAPVLPGTSNNGISGTWSPATVDNNNSATYTFTPSGGQCATPATLNITVNARPVVSVSDPAPICAGQSVVLIASGASTYNWSPGIGLSSTTGSSVTASPGSTTTYTVTGTASNGCTGVDDVTVVVRSTPVTSPIFRD